MCVASIHNSVPLTLSRVHMCSVAARVCIASIHHSCASNFVHVPTHRVVVRVCIASLRHAVPLIVPPLPHFAVISLPPVHRPLAEPANGDPSSPDRGSVWAVGGTTRALPTSEFPSTESRDSVEYVAGIPDVTSPLRRRQVRALCTRRTQWLPLHSLSLPPPPAHREAAL